MSNTKRLKRSKSRRKSRKNKPSKSRRKVEKIKRSKSLRKSRKRSKSLKKILKGGMEKDTDPYKPLPQRNSKRQERIALTRLSNVFGELSIAQSTRPSTKSSIEEISTSMRKLGLKRKNETEDDGRPGKK